MEGGGGQRARSREEKIESLLLWEETIGWNKSPGYNRETEAQKSRVTFQGDSFTPLLSQTDDSGPGKPLMPPDKRKDYMFS